MKRFKKDDIINCRTVEEQEMVLDIFEMLDYHWREGQQPRVFSSYRVPMRYAICGDCRSFVHGPDIREGAAIEAKDLRNMYISLKRRT